MNVVVPCWKGDAYVASWIADLARSCSGLHTVHLVTRGDVDVSIVTTVAGGSPVESRVKADGIPKDAWPAGPNWMFRWVLEQMVDRMSPILGPDSFLWLEPDAVLTRRSALDEIQDAWSAALRSNPRLARMGHWKTPPETPLAPVQHMSGSAVYAVTPELVALAGKCPPSRPFDLDAFFYKGRLRPDQGRDTKLIRCFYGLDAGVIERYYERLHAGAALIHGDKTMNLFDRVVRERFAGTPIADRLLARGAKG